MSLIQELLKFIPDPTPKALYNLPVERHERNIERVDYAALEKRPLNTLGIHLSEHWAVVGKTGSGKTHFAKDLVEYLRRQYPHAKRYILDSTEDGMDEIVGRLDVRGNKVPDLLRNSTYTQIWTPDTDSPTAYNEWFEKILYAREPAVVLVDELASLTNGKSGDPPDGFIKLMKQGRKHGVTVINLTQEIARVSPTIFRQMSHFVLFRINAETYDMTMARKYLEVDKERQKQPSSRYGFFYRRTDPPTEAREFASAQVFFNQRSKS